MYCIRYTLRLPSTLICPYRSATVLERTWTSSKSTCARTIRCPTKRLESKVWRRFSTLRSQGVRRFRSKLARQSPVPHLCVAVSCTVSPYSPPSMLDLGCSTCFCLLATPPTAWPCGSNGLEWQHIGHRSYQAVHSTAAPLASSYLLRSAVLHETSKWSATLGVQ